MMRSRQTSTCPAVAPTAMFVSSRSARIPPYICERWSGKRSKSLFGCSVASVYERAATDCASYVCTCQPFGASHGTTPRR